MINRTNTTAVLTMLLIACGSTTAQDTTARSPAELAAAFEPSLVRVEVTLQYDKGQPPTGAGLTEQCPSCGRYHVQRGDEYVEHERPFELGGYLIAADRVLAPDLTTHPRFVAGIEIVQGESRITATPVAYARDQHAMVLQLSAPLSGTAPLTFDGSAPGPYKIITHSRLNGWWTTNVTALSMDSITAGRHYDFVAAPTRGLIVSAAGQPVGMTMTGELPLDDSWKGSPDDWTWITAEAYDAMLSGVESLSDVTILRTKLDLRSPKTSQNYNPYGYGAEGEEETELDVVALRLDETYILVLAELKPQVTARLETITVHPIGHEPINATFLATLRDYGAFLATLDEPLRDGAPLSEQSITDFQYRLLPAADVWMQGEDRIAYYNGVRIIGYDVGWRRNLYPQVPGDASTLFVFDDADRVLAFSIPRRDWTGEMDYWGGGSDPELTAAAQIRSVLDDIAEHVDDSNVPLSEEEESRVAWTGIVMQELDAELARVYEVSELSQDGYIGGIVSFIYPDSPAEQAGIQNGDILLRVHVDRLPRPLDISADTDFGMNFPWNQFDEIPEEYFEMIPSPWPAVDNTFNRTLTGLGFGTECEIELFRDGEIVHVPMTVVESPPHNTAAPKFESETVGITVKPMTYEVRRYFQKTTDDPGVIISRIEPGSKASVGGIKPYEIVLEVNDTPINSNDDFRDAIAGQTELRITVERMHRSRVVKLVFNEPITVDEDADDVDGLGDVVDEVGDAIEAATEAAIDALDDAMEQE